MDVNLHLVLFSKGLATPFVGQVSVLQAPIVKIDRRRVGRCRQSSIQSDDMQILVCAEYLRFQVVDALFVERDDCRGAGERRDGVLVVGNESVLVEHMPGRFLAEIGNVVVVAERHGPFILRHTAEDSGVPHYEFAVRHDMFNSVFRVWLCPQHLYLVHRGVGSIYTRDGF